MKQFLSPTLADLRSECVLVQAWKKTAAHIRQHSWYADTLELDYQSLNLPSFIADLQRRLNSPVTWAATPLDLVPAPKAQHWELQDGNWQPKKGEEVGRKLRPLAHVALQDQVLATAMMMCLADRVETAAGDPRLSTRRNENRRQVLAYGHRLFCDADDGSLQHRWGSSKLYRQFYHDYQTFLERPRLVAKSVDQGEGLNEIAIVHSDLSKFYDRVRPAMLYSAVKRLQQPADDAAFFNLFRRVFDWTWREKSWPSKYGQTHKIEGFDSIALPQGLVAAGFFANIVLREFEALLRRSLDRPLTVASKFVLLDACYYVDDFRLVLRVPKATKEIDIELETREWLQRMLDKKAQGLLVESNKTKATVEGREKRFLVQQSKAATRIQGEVSGTFDMLHGTELIGAIEGFFHTQQRYSSSQSPKESGRSGLLVGISDLRDDTAARFAAGKYRRTFRSLRPLLESEAGEDVASEPRQEDEEGVRDTPVQLVLSRQQLDEKARLFAAMLIEEWVSNPGNVRLLRIALDIFPDEFFLDRVLELLRDGWKAKGKRGPRKDVRLYCLSELFRAGATETGMVRDGDCLPAGVSVQKYHETLGREAAKIVKAFSANPRSSARLPWYLMQQVFLYLSAQNNFSTSFQGPKPGKHDKLVRYKQMARFLAGIAPTILHERCILLVVAVSAFGHTDILRQFSEGAVSPDFLKELAEISPETAAQLWSRIQERANVDQKAAARSLGLANVFNSAPARSTVGSLSNPGQNPFYEEENLLALAKVLLEVPYAEWPVDVTPWQVNCSLHEKSRGQYFGLIDEKSISFSDRPPRAKSFFAVPQWCETDEDGQKQKLGMLLRYALRGSINFHSGVNQRLPSPLPRYRTPLSHWEQQRHSAFQGRSAFGPPWLPISSTTEAILFELLRWPGCGVSTPVQSVAEIADQIRARLKKLKSKRGKATKLTFLEQSAMWPEKPPKDGWQRPLRVGIVQSIIPDFNDYSAHSNDPELKLDPAFRARQRRHLAALLEGVSQMLRVRETHRHEPREDRRVLDLLVFPELAIHPQDVDSLLLPFVRAHKCMILCGLVYHIEATLPGQPLTNSCLWMIPEWSRSAGFQVRRIEQGKEHLAGCECSFTPSPVGFRPAQWLVEYHWHSDSQQNRPLVLSASVCFDATDLGLASDLKSRSDFYVVCALNRDVGTFDRMAEGLHYHMYQAVMVVNNGQFGGSNLFMPFQETFHRQVLHLHGQPQATIAFAEISPRKLIERPGQNTSHKPEGIWKTPPAGSV